MPSANPGFAALMSCPTTATAIRHLLPGYLPDEASIITLPIMQVPPCCKRKTGKCSLTTGIADIHPEPSRGHRH